MLSSDHWNSSQYFWFQPLENTCTRKQMCVQRECVLIQWWRQHAKPYTGGMGSRKMILPAGQGLLIEYCLRSVLVIPTVPAGKRGHSAMKDMRRCQRKQVCTHVKYVCTLSVCTVQYSACVPACVLSFTCRHLKVRASESTVNIRV